MLWEQQEWPVEQHDGSCGERREYLIHLEKERSRQSRLASGKPCAGDLHITVARADTGNRQSLRRPRWAGRIRGRRIALTRAQRPSTAASFRARHIFHWDCQPFRDHSRGQRDVVEQRRGRHVRKTFQSGTPPSTLRGPRDRENDGAPNATCYAFAHVTAVMSLLRIRRRPPTAA